MTGQHGASRTVEPVTQDLNALHRTLESIWEDAMELKRFAGLLNGEHEDDFERALKLDATVPHVNLGWHRDRFDTRNWLAGHVTLGADAMELRIRDLMNDICHEANEASRAAMKKAGA